MSRDSLFTWNQVVRIKEPISMDFANGVLGSVVGMRMKGDEAQYAVEIDSGKDMEIPEHTLEAVDD